MSSSRIDVAAHPVARRVPLDNVQRRHKAPLTSSERNVLDRVLAGESNQQIAEHRRTSLRTVANQIAGIFRKVGVGSRREVCAIAIAAAEPEAERAGRLTSRENQVVTLAALGHSNKAIAHELGLAPGTVGVILTRVTTKLGATSPRHLVSTWLRADQL